MKLTAESSVSKGLRLHSLRSQRNSISLITARPSSFQKASQINLVLKEASRLYGASWVRDIGPDLRPNDYKKQVEGSEDEPNSKKSTTTQEPSVFEDLVAARGGMEKLRPALQRVYMTRASAYRDALKSLIEGYQEGVHQAREKKEESKTQQESDSSKKLDNSLL